MSNTPPTGPSAQEMPSEKEIDAARTTFEPCADDTFEAACSVLSIKYPPASLDECALAAEKAGKILARAVRGLQAELRGWRTLCQWGGTPDIIHDFIKGQQDRIHVCQKLEEERDRLRAELQNANGAWNTLANISDICRSRGFEDGPTDERVIALAQDRDKARDALAAAVQFAQDYARKNPKYYSRGYEQDPHGVHRWLEENDKALDAMGGK